MDKGGFLEWGDDCGVDFQFESGCWRWLGRFFAPG
jgi:hypothetical protein